MALLSACGGDTVRYTVGGTLSGLAAGQTLTLANGSNTVTLNTSGHFVFATALASGASYDVQVSGAQPAWQNCSVSNGQGSIARASVSDVAVTCVNIDSVATGELNDTGIDWCTENITTPSIWVNYALCSAIEWGVNLWGPQQDAFFGRDAQARAGTLSKVGSGMAGFDFTRIGASGKLLAQQNALWDDNGTEAASTRWDCVRDNVTGLVWETKRNEPSHLRHVGHSYTWYNPVATTNGGSAGAETGGTCTGVADPLKCNTQSYVTAVNAAGLCGKSDWRLPTLDELHGLAHHGRVDPAIDTDHFPTTANGSYWSSSPNAASGFLPSSVFAWAVVSSNGKGEWYEKHLGASVRLVRSGQ